MPSSLHELELFAREALVKGLGRERIRNVLLDAGWSADQVRSALSGYAEVEFPVPVPRPRPQLSSREAFLYALLFSSLYLSAYHLGSLLFELINHAFPDPAVRAAIWNRGDGMRWSIAYLIIAFPLFTFVSIFVGREVALNPVKRLSPVRRWLTYLTLFIASGSLIGDLTTLVFNVLGGELTIRIALKVIVVGVIAGAVFGYYLSDLRREEKA